LSVMSERAEKTPWILILSIAIFLPIISTFWWTLEAGAWAPNFTLGPSQTSFNFPNGAYIVPILLIGFAWFFKRRISLRALTFAYVSALIAVSFSSYTHPGCQFTGFMHSRENPLHDPYLPEFWVPPKEVVSDIFMGGKPLNWDAWLPCILFWWLMPFLYWLYFTSFFLIFRRAWIVNEALPYPYGLAAFEIVNLSVSEEKSVSKTIFKYAFIVGFLFFLPFTLANLFPFLPDIYGWTKPPFETWCPGVLSDPFALFPALRGIAGFSSVNLNPVVYALMFLAPLNTLLSVFIFWLIIEIIVVQVLYVMGYYSGIEVQGVWGRQNMIALGEPLKLSAFSMLGVLPGILIWWIIANRRYFISTIKLAIGGSSKEVEVEEVSYRYTYLMLLIGFIGLLAIMVLSGAEPHVSAVYLIGVGVVYVAMARIHGFLGPQPHNPYWMQGLTKWAYPYVTWETRTQSQVIIGSMSGWWGVEYRMGHGSADLAGDAFRFSENAHVNAKSIFKAMFVTALISPLVGFLTFLLWSNYYGIMKLPFPHESDYCMMGVSDPENWNVWPAPEPWWPHALLGFLVAGFLMYLNIKVPWLPLDSYGLVIATNHWINTLLGFPWACLGAWIVKTLVIRLGGTRVYREYGVPAAVGFIAGYVIAAPLLAGLGGVLRFFFPV